METPTGAAPSGASGYEFTAAQNEIIRTTGSRTRFWGLLTLIGGGLMALMGAGMLLTGEVYGIVAGIFYALLSLIPIFIGLNFRKAGQALGAVVTTEGSDIDHLMSSMENLGKAFFIQIVSSVVWIGIVVLGIVAGVIGLVLGG